VNRVATVKCPCCEGFKRVAIVRASASNPFARAVPELCNRPMTVTVARARRLMVSYESRDRRMAIVVKALAQHVTSVACPHCRATGVAFVVTAGEPVRTSSR
jgi:hypothetical protein